MADSIPKGTEVYEVICTPSGSSPWNEVTIKLLLSELPNMMEKFKTREYPSKKIMYQRLANFMRDHGHTFSYFQVENKWKTLLRSYRNSQTKAKLGLAGKYCPYRTEIKRALDVLGSNGMETENEGADESSMDPTGFIEFDCSEGEPASKRICDREAQAEYSAIAAQIVASEMEHGDNSKRASRSGNLLHSRQEQSVAQQLILLRKDLRQLHGRSVDSQIVDQVYLLREDIRRSQEQSERLNAKRHREMMNVLNTISSTLKSINSNQTLGDNGE